MNTGRFLLLLLILLTINACSPRPPREGALNLAWTFATTGAINHAPLIVRDTVIIAPAGAQLIALDLHKGRERWRFAPASGIWERAFASDGQRVFVGLKDGSIASLDVASGNLLWQTSLGINMQVPPLVSEGWVIAPTTFVGPELEPDTHGRAGLFALDAQTGAQRWAFHSDNYILQTPARSGDRLYVGGNFYDPNPIDEGGHTRIYALDYATGAPRWTYESEDGFPKRLYATATTVTFVGYQDFMNGVDAESGQLRWRFDTGNWTPSFLGAGEMVYFSSANTRVFALNVNTGETVWEFNIPGGSFNYLLDAPVLLDGRLYFLTQQGQFFALDAATGELLWQAGTALAAARTSPALAGEWVVMGDIEGAVYGYQHSPPSN